MSEFKSGEDVLFNGSEYVYIAKHPILTNCSVIQARGDDMRFGGSVLCKFTDSIKKKPKTHTVNGFEVPAPITEEEFEHLKTLPNNELCQKLFSFYPHSKKCFVYFYSWETSFESVKCGLVFKKELDIKKNIAALQGIDPSGLE